VKDNAACLSLTSTVLLSPEQALAPTVRLVFYFALAMDQGDAGPSNRGVQRKQQKLPLPEEVISWTSSGCSQSVM